MDKKIIISLTIFAILVIVGLIVFEIITSPGKLIINIVPQDSVVFIDDEYEELRQIRVDKGKHKISIKKSGYESLDEDFSVKYFGTTILEYTLTQSETIIGGLPYEDLDNNFYIFGYYDGDYKPTYRIDIFNKDGEALGKKYLKEKGVNLDKVNIIISSEYDDSGEAAPN